MNGRCETCEVEKQCDCCDYRKFKPLAQETAQVIQFTTDHVRKEGK